ncbi:MAG: PqiC family protein [Pseudomonadota bacterium]
MSIRLLSAFMLIATLPACDFGPETARFVPTPTQSELRARARVSTVEISEVTLPAYAASEEISLREEGGAIRSNPDFLWAELPENALTQALVENLSQITGAQVAANPWPLGDRPQVEVTVRVRTMLVSETGTLEFSGQYAIGAPEDAVREHVHAFALTETISGRDYQSIVDAHGRAWRRLAEDIARRGLR